MRPILPVLKDCLGFCAAFATLFMAVIGFTVIFSAVVFVVTMLVAAPFMTVYWVVFK